MIGRSQTYGRFMRIYVECLVREKYDMLNCGVRVAERQDPCKLKRSRCCCFSVLLDSHYRDFGSLIMSLYKYINIFL